MELILQRKESAVTTEKRATTRNVKQISITFLSIMLSMMMLQGCDEPGDEKKDLTGGHGEYYVLCEGIFTQADATLWSFNAAYDTVRGPLIWDTAGNPLGDVGQSFCLDGDTLYIIMNNSHQVRMVDLSGEPSHVGDIDLPGASPRYMAIQHGLNRAFISSWNLTGLLVLDLGTHTVTDTVHLAGRPEIVLIDGAKLYASLTMKSDWSSFNQVVQLDISDTEVTLETSYQVIEGPGDMVLSDDMLYVTGVGYDATWAATTGTSGIDLTSGEVISVNHGSYVNYTADIDLIDGVPYRVFGDGLVPLNPDLTLNLAATLVQQPNIYSFSVQNGQLMLGSSDYAAPDSIHIYSVLGDSLGTVTVAALPNEVVYY